MFKRFFAWLWSKIKTRWAYIASLVFFWVIPIILLNEQFSLLKTVTNGVKLSFVGICVVTEVFFAFRKKIYVEISRLTRSGVRGALKVVTKGVTYGIVLALCYFANLIAGRLYDWWILSGISWAVGAVFLILDEKGVSL